MNAFPQREFDRVANLLLPAVRRLTSILALSGCLHAQTLLHQWTFNDGANPGNDSVGGAHGSMLNGASRTADGQLSLDGIDDYFLSAALGGSAIGSKSLVVWVTLPNVSQSAGSALSLGDFSGTDVFDGIIFGELTTGQWMAGSNTFSRSGAANNGGATETVLNSQLMLAITYNNSTSAISLYRNGSVYATYTSGNALATFTASSAQVSIGLRHLDNFAQTGTATGTDPYFAGLIDEARVYTGVLSGSDISALAANGPVAIPEPALAGLILGLATVGCVMARRRKSAHCPVNS